MPTVTVSYFAQLREEAGRAQELRETSAKTANELYVELQKEHGFSLPVSQIKLAVGEAYTPMETPLYDGQSLVFIPPVTGG